MDDDMSTRGNTPRLYYVVHAPEAAFVFEAYEQAFEFARQHRMDETYITAEQMSPSYVDEIPEFPN